MAIFKARFTAEHEVQVEADNVEAASDLVRVRTQQIGAQSGTRYRLLGCIPVDQQWPDADLRSGGEPTRPAPPPPSGGTPGTPVIRMQDQVTQAVAA